MKASGRVGRARAVVPRVADDADDLGPGPGLALPAQARAGADRVPATEVSRHERLVDDDQARSRRDDRSSSNTRPRSSGIRIASK